MIENWPKNHAVDFLSDRTFVFLGITDNCFKFSFRRTVAKNWNFKSSLHLLVDNKFAAVRIVQVRFSCDGFWNFVSKSNQILMLFWSWQDSLLLWPMSVTKNLSNGNLKLSIIWVASNLVDSKTFFYLTVRLKKIWKLKIIWKEIFKIKTVQN